MRGEVAGANVYANGADATRPVIIRLEALSKNYQEAGRSRSILDELNREFYAGEFVCLLGKSGSGKSTLLNLISGIDAPSSGHVVICNGGEEVRITALSEQQRTLFRRRHIGIVFQFFNLIPTLTVLENVTLPLELAGRYQGIQAQAKALLDRVGLADRLATYPDKLSGGEQQRVAIARALLFEPGVLLADEPTGNLDSASADRLWTILREVAARRQMTVVVVTHEPVAASNCVETFVLRDGTVAGRFDSYGLTPSELVLRAASAGR